MFLKRNSISLETNSLMMIKNWQTSTQTQMRTHMRMVLQLSLIHISYTVGTKFMDADRYGIKRIKEVVGEDGSVVIRVYLLDPRQQSKRSARDEYKRQLLSYRCDCQLCVITPHGDDFARFFAFPS